MKTERLHFKIDNELTRALKKAKKLTGHDMTRIATALFTEHLPAYVKRHRKKKMDF